MSTVSLDRHEVVALAQSCGFHNASGWIARGDEFVLKQVHEIFSGIDDVGVEGPADDNLKPLFDALIKAVKDGLDIELVGDTPPESNGEGHQKGPKVSKEKKEKTPKEPKEPKNKDKTSPDGEAPKKRGRKPDPNKPPKEKKPPVEKDKFGCRVGSDKAKVNSVLSKKAKTMKEIKEAVGLENSFYNHLKNLMASGFVVKEDNGYKLAPKDSE